MLIELFYLGMPVVQKDRRADMWVPHFLRYWAILVRFSRSANKANADRTELFPNELSALNNLDFRIHRLIAIVSLKPTGVGM